MDITDDYFVVDLHQSNSSIMNNQHHHQSLASMVEEEEEQDDSCTMDVYQCSITAEGEDSYYSIDIIPKRENVFNLYDLPIDILAYLSSSFLDLKDLSSLDISCCNRAIRPLFLNFTSRTVFTGSLEDNKWKNNNEYAKYLCIRGIGIKNIKYDHGGFYYLLKSQNIWSRLEVLDLTDCKDSTEEGITKILKNCTSLIQVKLPTEIEGNEYVNNVTLSALQQLSESCTHIQSISMHFPSLCFMGTVGVNMFKNCTALDTLDFRDSFIHRSSIELLKKLGECSGIKSINCCRCYDLSSPHDFVASIARSFKSLTYLNISEMHGKLYDVNLLEVALSCPLLQSLNISKNNLITDLSIIKISEKCTLLISLDLSSNILITDLSVMKIGEKCSLLQNLNLTQCNMITNQCMMKIFEHCPDMQSLYSPFGTLTSYNDLLIRERRIAISNLWLPRLKIVNCLGILTGALAFLVIMVFSFIDQSKNSSSENLASDYAGYLFAIIGGCFFVVFIASFTQEVVRIQTLHFIPTI